MFKPNCLIAVISPEVSLKSKKVQERMRTILKKNIISSLTNNSISYDAIAYRAGRFFIYTNDLEKSLDVLKNCFGILCLIKTQKETICSLEDVKTLSLKISENKIRGEFAVRAKSFKKELKSNKVEIEVGSKLISNIPDLKVNLSNPKTQLNIVVFEEKAFFYFEEIKTINGMPVGVQGCVAVFAKENKIIYDLLKTGCKIILIEGSNKFKEMEKYNSYNSFNFISLEESVEGYNNKRIMAFFTDSRDRKEIEKLNLLLPVKIFVPYLLA